ncbi:MAG: hypothetical protein M1839_007120, partial [Geoglossum umbratile]
MPIHCSVPAGAHKRRHYEFAPGSFVFKEVILDDEDDRAPISPKTKGRRTRDKPFSLDLNWTGEISKPDSSPPLFPGVGDSRSPAGELPIAISTKEILSEQGGPEIRATFTTYPGENIGSYDGVTVPGLERSNKYRYRPPALGNSHVSPPSTIETEPELGSEISSCSPKCAGDSKPITAPTGADEGDGKQNPLVEKKRIETWSPEKRKKVLFSEPSPK